MPPLKSEIDPLDLPVWGRDGIAKILNMSPKRCEYLLAGGVLDADKFNGRLGFDAPPSAEAIRRQVLSGYGAMSVIDAGP
jgi:hypothetical protein